MALDAGPGLRKKVAIVTGGGGGIGSAVAARLAALGAFVVVNDLGTDREGTGTDGTLAERTVRAIRASGGHAFSDLGSVADPDECDALVARVMQQCGQVDILVNTAGNIRRGTLAESRQEDWESVMGVHLGGHLNMMRATVPAMAQSRGGQIVNVTSASGLLRVPSGSAAYATAKRAIAAMTWCWRDHAPPGVSVTAVAPVADTRMTSPTAQTAATKAGLSLATPEDIAPVFAALCASESAEFSGSVLFTNGRELSKIERPRCLELICGGAGPELIWQTCEQASRHNISVGGGLLPRYLSAAPEGTMGAPGLRAVIAAEGPLAGQLKHLFETHGATVVVVPSPTTTSFDLATLQLDAALAALGDIDILLVATSSPAPSGSPVPDPTTLLARLASHASWAHAAQSLGRKQTQSFSAWHVVTATRDRGAGHEVLREALSTLAVATGADLQSRARGYSASVIDDRVASIEALVAASVLFQQRDGQGQLCDHPLVISEDGVGCWAKAEVATTATSRDRWTERRVLAAVTFMAGR
jgi:NAD(P)-dependent dehydrogenase (short-subunit alcohol dehydrogenase family)